MKKAIDDYYGYTPDTTKNIKSKPSEIPDMEEVDGKFTKFSVGTKFFKVFNDVEYKGTINGYDLK